MPHFTLRIEAGGPLLNVALSVSQAREAALRAQNVGVPNPVSARGLVDTGATCTCVDPSVISELGIPASGETTVMTPSTTDGPVSATQYDMGIKVYAAPTQHPLVIRNLAVIESPLLKQQGFHALIGRDVLSRCVLVHNGGAEFFTLAF